jgi:hypothetical protein
MKKRRMTGFSMPPLFGDSLVGDQETIGNFADPNLNSTLGSQGFA